MKPGPIPVVIAVLVCSLAVVEQAPAFSGARLLNPRAGIGLTFGGTAFARISCAGGTDGFCQGTITVTRLSGSLLASVPFASRSSDTPSIEVPLKGSRRSILRHGRVAVNVTIASHDTADVPSYITTTARSLLK